MIYRSRKDLLPCCPKKAEKGHHGFTLYTREGVFLIFKKVILADTPLLVEHISSFRHAFCAITVTPVTATCLLLCYRLKDKSGCYLATQIKKSPNKPLPCYLPMWVGSVFNKTEMSIFARIKGDLKRASSRVAPVAVEVKNGTA